MILVVLAVAFVLLVGLLACLLFCWHEPVRRGGYLPMSDAELLRRVKKHTRPIGDSRRTERRR